MAAASRWGLTPRQSIERECRRRGKDDVIYGCRQLIRRQPVDIDLVLALGGPAAEVFFDGQSHDNTYWLRVWGLRGLLWTWGDTAMPEVALALDDEAWRVREMAFKVISRHLLGDFMPEAAAGRDDGVPRVRRAAHRALIHLTASRS